MTVEDVIWSMQTLAEKGLPRYRNAWEKVAKVEQTGERSVRFTFDAADSELPLIIGLRPVLKKADWEGIDFAASSLRVPVGSGPYTVGEFEPGRFVTFRRNPDYWGKDLPINRGVNNFDTIRYDYFVDAGVLFQAFTAGELSVYRELSPSRWASEYDLPAVSSGQIVKEEIPHGRPSGMEGFVFNTRRPVFQDWRVRDALLHAFNFEFINQTLNGGAFPRRASYFANSELGMGTGPAEGRVRELLEPFADSLVPGALDGYALPASDGSERNRANMRAAAKQLEAAGWTVQNGVLRDAAGAPFAFEILLTAGQSEAVANIFSDALRQLGIEARVKLVDQAQYNARKNDYDYDMVVNTWNMSLSPGNEQTLYWGKEGMTVPGTRNYMGIDSPAAEAMIAEMLATRDPAEFQAAVQALDRVLTTGRYVIPFWFSDRSLIAHKAELRHPETCRSMATGSAGCRRSGGSSEAAPEAGLFRARWRGTCRASARPPGRQPRRRRRQVAMRPGAGLRRAGGGGCGQAVRAWTRARRSWRSRRRSETLKAPVSGRSRRRRAAAARSSPWISVAMRGAMGSPRR